MISAGDPIGGVKEKPIVPGTSDPAKVDKPDTSTQEYTAFDAFLTIISPAPALYLIHSAYRSVSAGARKFSEKPVDTDVDRADSEFSSSVGFGEDGEQDKATNGLIAGGTFFTLLYGGAAIARSIVGGIFPVVPTGILDNPLSDGQPSEA